MRKVRLSREIIFFSMLLFFSAGYLRAQKITLRKDTVFLQGAAYLICKKGDDHKRYEIKNLTGQQLIDIHNSRMQLNGKTSYVITFLNDNRQAMIIEQKPFPLSFLNELLKNKLLEGGVVDVSAETVFITTHPLPDGYTDIDQIVNY